ncbi:MAG: hypothetical protein QXR96_02880 [Candidatus Woesearchaeota archaeon]
MNKKEKNKEKIKSLKKTEKDLIELEDDILELEQEKIEESKLKKVLKKIYLILITFFIIFLLISNLFGFHILNIIFGKIISKNIDENYEIDLANKNLATIKIIFGKENYNALLQIFRQNQNAEIKMCLFGNINITDSINKYKVYNVKGIYVPKIFNRDVFSVTSEICDKNTIIELHTHPILHCVFSNQDIESYNQIKKYNPNVIMGLMCDEKRFNFYFD